MKAFTFIEDERDFVARVKYFASLRNKIGVPENVIEARDVKELLGKLHSELDPDISRYLRMCTVLVNGKNVIHLKGKKTTLGPEDTVSIFPPLGGG